MNGKQARQTELGTMNPLHHYLIENAPRFLSVVTIRTQAKELKTTTQAPFTRLVFEFSPFASGF